MTKRYFELNEDMSSPERWVLHDTLDAQGKKVGARLYLNEVPVRFEGRLRVPILHPGSPLDFSLADAGDFPVVTEKVASTLAELAPGDIQLYPAAVDTRPEPYFLVNVARLVRCIDEAASEEVRYGEPEDNLPDELGYYLSVYGMRIDPSQVGDAKVFRPWGYPAALLVAEDVKEALERIGATGLRFTTVTGPSVLSDEERARDLKIRELLETAATAREAVWRSLGSLDEEFLMPIAASSAWPGQRQLWCVIRREAGRTLLVTHGLSDPFIDRVEPSVGFGLELALEVDAAMKDFSKGWPLLLLDRVANEVVEYENVRKRAKAGLFSMEVSGEGMPEPLVTPEGRVAVLLGAESRTLPGHLSTPYGAVKLVTVKVLLPSELAYLLEHGAKGQAELARRFEANGEEHVSRADRRPVV
jgi:hypothetical protein